MERTDEMRRLTRWMLLGMAVAACGGPPAAGPAPASDSVLPGGMAGCYELRPTRSLYYAPSRIHLQASPAPEFLRQMMGDSVWGLTRLDRNGRPMTEDYDQPFLYWTALFPPDSIRIVITTGHSGSELVVPVQPGGDTLRGRAVEIWDFGPPTDQQGSPVMLIRIPCIQ